MIYLLLLLLLLSFFAWFAPNRIKVFLAGAGANAIVGAFSFAVVAALGWGVTAAMYWCFAPPSLGILTGDKPLAAAITSTDGGVVSPIDGFKVADVQVQSSPTKVSSSDALAVTEWQVIMANEKNTPLLRIRIEEISNSTTWFNGTREIACQIAVPGRGTQWPSTGESRNENDFELPLERFVLYRSRPSSLLTPFTFTIETPASVHVFDKAIAYSLHHINEESPFYKDKTASGYTKNEQAQLVLKKTLGSQFRRTFGNLALHSQSARRVNGEIQWCTVWVFCALLIVLGSRYVTYVHLEEKAVPKERRRRQAASTAGPATDGLAKHETPLSLEDLKNPDHVKLDVNTENARLKAAVELRDKSEDGTKLWHGVTSTCTAPAFLELYKEAASAFLLSRDYKAVPEFVDSKASSLIDERSARLGAVKYFLWAIPSIGFVGTVVGIGNALLATIDVDAVDPVTASIAKSMVSSSIGVAFDTTLVALLLSLIAMLIYHLATQAEELVVNDAADNVRDLFIQGGVHVDDETRASALVNALADSLSDVERSTEQLKQTADELRAISGLDAKVQGGVNQIGSALKTLAGIQKKQWQDYVESVERKFLSIRRLCILLVVAVSMTFIFIAAVAWQTALNSGWFSAY